MPRIFISYSRTDEVFARQLATSLSDMGADIWIDVEDIPAGMKWSSAIQQGLDAADLLIVIISPDSMASRNVEDEWQYYLDNGKPVIPVLLHPTKIHFQLSRIQYIDFNNQAYQIALRQLYVELKRKGVRLNPNITEPTAAYLPTPHQYPVAPPKRNRLWLWGAAGVAIIAVALVAALGVVAILSSDNPTPSAAQPEVTQVAELATATDAPPPTSTIPPTTAPTHTPPPPTLIQLGFPGYPVTRNADWSPVLRTFAGMEMVLVPAGSFTMGINDAQVDAAWQGCLSVIGNCNRSLFEDELFGHTIAFERPFWIGRYEVNNAAYGSPGSFPGENNPRTNVTWYEAHLHCQAKGARLPTEAEWEYAARGPDGLTYPWGSTFDGSRLNYCDRNCEFNWRDANFSDGYAHPAPVGSYPGGASWVGALDMSGNVWEWTSTIYSFSYPYNPNDGRENLNDINAKRVLRGGSWNWIAADARTTARADYAGQNVSSDWYGFRCARDWEPGE